MEDASDSVSEIQRLLGQSFDTQQVQQLQPSPQKQAESPKVLQKIKIKKVAEAVKEVPKLKIGQLASKTHTQSNGLGKFEFDASGIGNEEYAEDLKRIQDTMKHIQMLDDECPHPASQSFSNSKSTFVNKNQLEPDTERGPFTILTSSFPNTPKQQQVSQSLDLTHSSILEQVPEDGNYQQKLEQKKQHSPSDPLGKFLVGNNEDFVKQSLQSSFLSYSDSEPPSAAKPTRQIMSRRGVADL